MDKVIIAMLVLLSILCLVSAIPLAIFTVRRGDDMWYLEPEEADEDFDPDRPGLIVLTSLVTSFILYGYLIPISLYVSLEIVKVLQVFIVTIYAAVSGVVWKEMEKILLVYKPHWFIVCGFFFFPFFLSFFLSGNRSGLLPRT